MKYESYLFVITYGTDRCAKFAWIEFSQDRSNRNWYALRNCPVYITPYTAAGGILVIFINRHRWMRVGGDKLHSIINIDWRKGHVIVNSLFRDDDCFMVIRSAASPPCAHEIQPLTK